jgi:glycosyltransferase involved in cell wall biosynthesis
MAAKNRRPKVAVYTIALNEKQFVERWYESAKEADYLLIADTGSTDGTRKAAIKLGINVIDISIKPWRFDDARNASLAALPADIDICVQLDMDEILIAGWVQELQKAFEQNPTKIRYNYIWNWKDEAQTIPSSTFGADKIHARHGYRWKYPVHEAIVPYGGTVEKQVWTQLEIHHHPDDTKSRSQYLPLLKLATEEDPGSDRNAHYYARELYFNGMYSDAAKEFRRHLELPTAVWKPERASSMRYLAKIEEDEREQWLVQAHMEAPWRREALVELAQHLYSVESWASCKHFALKAIEISEKPLDYLCEDFAWGALPWDLAAIASYNLGEYASAYTFGMKAAILEPENARLKKNLEFYKAKADPSSL